MCMYVCVCECFCEGKWVHRIELNFCRAEALRSSLTNQTYNIHTHTVSKVRALIHIFSAQSSVFYWVIHQDWQDRQIKKKAHTWPDGRSFGPLVYIHITGFNAACCCLARTLHLVQFGSFPQFPATTTVQ